MNKVDYDKVLAYLVAVATVINLLKGSVKNIQGMRTGKQNKKRRPSTKRKRRKYPKRRRLATPSL